MPDGAQHFVDNPCDSVNHCVDLILTQCKQCGTVQHLGARVKNYRNVIRSTKFSSTMTAFRRKQFSALRKTNGEPITTVFELGAGEGEYLDIFQSLGCQTYGMEHSRRASKLATQKGHKITCGFLNGRKLPKNLENEKFDSLTSFNFIEHLPAPTKTLSLLKELLKPNGVALFEVPNFDIIESHSLFNEFIPDHISYFTKKTFHTLLSISGYEVMNIDQAWDGYVLSATARLREKTEWSRFLQKRKTLRREIINFFGQNRAEKNAVWSAGHQSLSTISNLDLEQFFHCLIDSSSAKQGKFAPASSLPIVEPEVLRDGVIDRVLIAAAGFNEEIVQEIQNNYADSITLAVIDKGCVKNVTPKF